MATKTVSFPIKVPNSQHCFAPTEQGTYHCEFNNLFDGGRYKCALFNSSLQSRNI